MTDGQGAEDKQLPVVPGDEGSDAAQPAAAPVDPWAAAFAEVEDKAPAVAAGVAPGAAGDDIPAVPAEGAGVGAIDAPVGAGDAGGLVPAAPDAGDADGATALEDIPATIERYSAEIEQRSINETAQLFLERANDQGQKLIRQTNGQLGATINDSDIYRVGDDGTAAFYNPDTGRPFTGDNPRAQAKQWVEQYNEELRDTFNRFAEQRKGELTTELAPVVELLKFTPTYEGLDPVRQNMLDALLEGYEVYDKAGDHIGYSVDLNQALARVNKQISAIQVTRKVELTPPTGPALDMPTVGGSGTPGKPIASLDEAMEALQDAELAKQKR